MPRGSHPHRVRFRQPNAALHQTRARALYGAVVPQLRCPANQQRLVEGADKAPDTVRVDRLVYCRSKFSGARKSFRIPSNMLAGESGADLAAVMSQHVFVMTEHDVALRAQRWIGASPAVPKPLRYLASEPRPSTASAANHQAVGSRFAQRLIGTLEAYDVAIDDDRDAYRILDETDEVPVGGAGIELAARVTVDGDHADPACFGNPRKPGCVAVAIIPAGAHLKGDRQIDCLDRRLEDACSMSLVAHQR